MYSIFAVQKCAANALFLKQNYGKTNGWLTKDILKDTHLQNIK
jgi:hypothetical protein